MQKRFVCLALAFCMACMFTACSSLSFGNAGELLRAPVLGQEEGKAQAALAAYLGTEPVYKYPREGSIRSPLLMVDLNGDGVNECIAFYSVPERNTNNVYVALLELREGEWVLRFEREGRSTEVASIEVATMFGDATRQLVVGYGNANLSNKLMVLYDYTDDILNYTELEGQYDSYLLDDFTGRGGQDLAVVFNDNRLRVSFFTGRNGKFETLQEGSVELHQNFISCVGMQASVSADEERFIIVDGIIEQNSQLASQILVLALSDTGTMRFYLREADAASQQQAINETLRTSTLLTSRDIGSDGRVETPVSATGTKPNAVADDLNLELIDWVDFTAEEPYNVYFGLFDAYHGLYINLPESWRTAITVTEGEESGNWQIWLDGIEDSPVLQLMDSDEEESLPENAQFILGTQQSFLVKMPGLTASEQLAIGILPLT